MTVNPAGYQPVFDYGAPQIIGAYAKEYISGGELVFASGADNVVSSGGNSFATTDITVAAKASGAQFLGIAVHAAASGAPISVATNGVFILTADGTVTASYPVTACGANAVANSGSVAANIAFQRTVGRALTSAGSEGYCLVQVGRS